MFDYILSSLPTLAGARLTIFLFRDDRQQNIEMWNIMLHCILKYIYLLDIGDSVAAKHIVMASSPCRMNQLLHHQPKDQVLLVFQVSC